MKFDKFIAVDWSGAKGKYDGIAVASCRAGRSAPKLIHPPKGTRWTRQVIADWLIKQLSGSERLLIGLDFGFSLPFENDLGYLAGRLPAIQDVFELWSHIEARSCDESDFGCTSFIDDPEYAALFWKAGRQPKDWIDRKRLTENTCSTATKTHPLTLYKLIGSKQVGKASISGIRVLHHVRTAIRDRVAIWPFEPVHTSAIVEIYPTLFRKLGTREVSKIRSILELNIALKILGSNPPVRSPTEKWSDHETDALVSAAGLRSFSGDPNVWSRPEIVSPQVLREGWIFGA